MPAAGVAHASLDAVEAKGAPVVAVEVERHQVPAMAAVDDRDGLDVAAAGLVIARDVGELEPGGVAAGGGERREDIGVDPWALEGECRCGAAQRADAAAQPGGENLLELGQRAHRGLLDARNRARGGGAQPDGDGDRLGVIEQQRRQLAAGAQPVAPGHPRRGLHRVAERAELVDVAPDRARRHLEATGQLLAGPFAAYLQQGQECEEACGCLNHGALKPATNCGPKLSARPISRPN